MASLYVLCRESDLGNIRYVGITKHEEVEKRLQAHNERANAGTIRPLYSWIRKHDDVVIIKLEGDLEWEAACKKEISLIKSLREVGADLLNMTDGGEGSLGIIQSEETKLKRIEKLKNRPRSEETKNKISLSNTGKIRSVEARLKMSEAKKGKKLSEDHKKKIGEKLKGRPCSKETAEKISRSQKGKKLSPQHLANLRAAQQKRRQREQEEKKNKND